MAEKNWLVSNDVAQYKLVLCKLWIMELHSPHYSTNFVPSYMKKVGNKQQKVVYLYGFYYLKVLAYILFCILHRFLE